VYPAFVAANSRFLGSQVAAFSVVFSDKEPSMAENKFSLDTVDLRSGGINDLPELAMGARLHSDQTVEPSSSVSVQVNEAVAPSVEETSSSPSSGQASSRIWNLVSKVRSTLPLVAKILPLLDSGIATALAPVSSALAPQPTVNTKAIERSINDVQSIQRDLRTHVQNHALQLKRIEEQLVHVRDEVERNSREQQNKIEEIRSSIGTLKIIGICTILVLLVGVGLEGWILFRRF
jgi:hypothetical protein